MHFYNYKYRVPQSRAALVRRTSVFAWAKTLAQAEFTSAEH